jgi:hypothetical protein
MEKNMPSGKPGERKYRWDEASIILVEALAAQSKTLVELTERFRERTGFKFGRGAIAFSYLRRTGKILSDYLANPSASDPTPMPGAPMLEMDEGEWDDEPTLSHVPSPSPAPSPAPAPTQPVHSGDTRVSPPPNSPEELYEKLFRLAGKRPTTLEEACDHLEMPPARVRLIAASAAEAGYRIELSGDGQLGDLERYRMIEDAREMKVANRRLLEQLGDKDRQIEALTDLGSSPVLPFVAPKGRGEGKQRLGVPVLLCSDWHVEERVDPEKVNGLNEYNPDIADACITRVAEGFEWLVRDPRFDMRSAIIWLGGDLFSGYIHAELQESNFLSPVQAVAWLQERLERMLRHVLATTEFERILVVCNDGNHGRMTQKMRAATRTANSLEWLLYKVLASRFKEDPRIQFQIADGEYNYVDIFGAQHGFFHGDSVQYMGGVGGLLIPMQRGLNELRKYRKLDHVSFGHFHERMDLPDLSGNGSMIGITPWGMGKKFKPQKRRQSFFIWDSVEGKTSSAPVWMI